MAKYWKNNIALWSHWLGATKTVQAVGGEWWCLCGQRARLILWWSELESRWSLRFFSKIVVEKNKIYKERSRLASKKLPNVYKICTNYFTRKMRNFDTFYKNYLKCGQFGQNNGWHWLWKVYQSAINRPIWSYWLARLSGWSSKVKTYPAFLANFSFLAWESGWYWRSSGFNLSINCFSVSAIGDPPETVFWTGFKPLSSRLSVKLDLTGSYLFFNIFLLAVCP